jgi:peptide methionine sulfoxide reductase MsrA
VNDGLVGFLMGAVVVGTALFWLGAFWGMKHAMRQVHDMMDRRGYPKSDL